MFEIQSVTFNIGPPIALDHLHKALVWAREHPNSEIALYANRLIVQSILAPSIRPLPFDMHPENDSVTPTSEFWIRIRRTQPVDPPATWEHASWLTAANLERLFGDRLEKSKVFERDLIQKSLTEQMDLILASSSSFVAVVDERGQFRRLYNRRQMIEQLAHGYAHVR